MKRKIVITLFCITLTAAMLSGCGNTNETGETAVTEAVGENVTTEDETIEEKNETFYGNVTAVNGSMVTIALGELPDLDLGGKGEMPGGEGTEGSAPELPQGDGTEGSAPELPQGDGTEGSAPEPPQGDGTATNGEIPGGNGAGMGQGGMDLSLTLTGEEKTVAVTEATTLDSVTGADTQDIEITDITTGDTVYVVMDGEAVVSMTVLDETALLNLMMPSGEQPIGDGNISGSSTGSIALTGAYTVDGESVSAAGEDYSSDTTDENVILAANGASLKLSDATLTKAGNTSSADESNFYAVNAIVAAAGGSTIKLSDCELTSDSEGSNAVFATGDSVIQVNNVTIHTTADSSRGLDATYNGTVNAENVTITTEGAHCAPIATDRGEGTITVKSGSVTSSGEGSPCIYSTGNITVEDVSGTANGAQTCVIEGKNSITMTNCDLTGNGENGVMLYQSTSGDAAEGTSVLTAMDSKLISKSNGPFFYVTNTDAVASLDNTTLTYPGDILVQVSGNETNNWGTPGENGGNFELTGKNQVLEGNITVDEISTMILNLTEGTTYTGSIDSDHTAQSMTLNLDADSSWTVNGDSYVTVLTDTDDSLSNIYADGYTIYYDASNEGNAWLNAKTIELPNGGTLKPIEA